MHFILSVTVFSTTVIIFIGDTIFTSPTGDGTAILCGRPSQVKVQPFAGQKQYLHFSVILRPWESNPWPPTLQSSINPAAVKALSRFKCTLLRSWLCITRKEVLAIFLGVHFQIRELYVGGRGSFDRKLPSHAYSTLHSCVPISHTWQKSLSHYSINWHILKIN